MRANKTSKRLIDETGFRFNCRGGGLSQLHDARSLGSQHIGFIPTTPGHSKPTPVIILGIGCLLHSGKLLSHAALRSLGRVQTAVVNAERGAQHIGANLEPCVRLKFGCKCRVLGPFADLAHAIRGFAGEVNLG